ncbi:hypothetical protein L195_g042763 [Trifolium pratense]|uniref:Uncharacterized protein n=1 Tax=Trifolium pratense TaxID=57577 RepID=A0A2K3M7A0_TRIPR|nr:hypothetical protein L195_g042763 [Trifolium pratense]
MIDVGLDRKYHSSISRNCNQEGLKPLDVGADPEPSLIGPMMIGVGLGRDDHGLIRATAIGRGLKPFDVRANPESN